jgi:hypothetical protein
MLYYQQVEYRYLVQQVLLISTAASCSYASTKLLGSVSMHKNATKSIPDLGWEWISMSFHYL